MNRETAKEEIKRLVSCKAYLEESKSGMYCCPLCGSGHNEHGTGAVKVYEDTNTWYCHACQNAAIDGRRGDVINAAMLYLDLDYNETLEALASDLDITIDPYTPGKQPARIDFKAVKRSKGKIYREEARTPQNGPQKPTGASRDYTAYYQECKQRLTDPAAVAYLKSRGISLETAEAYNLGYDPEADTAGAGHPCPRLIIPTSKAHFVARRIDGIKDFAKLNPKGSTPAIFNKQALYESGVQEVFVVEGIFDALSIIETGAPAIALNGAGNGDILLKELERRPTTAGLILCPDNDEDPKTRQRVWKQFKKLSDGLQRLNVSHITAEIFDNIYKDANEALIADRNRFEGKIEQNREKVKKPDSASYYIENLMAEEIDRFKREIKTGFENLDQKAGGLYSGLYVIAAISSLGKTTFAAQMADQIAAGGTDVLFFSMEQSRLEIISKSIARTLFKKDPGAAVSSLAIRRGFLPSPVIEAIKEYQKTAGKHISVIEGNLKCDIAFIRDYIKRYIRDNTSQTGCRPVVIIDYLQVLQPDQEMKKHNAQEIIDTIITELKRISRDFDITIFVISSVNRANYLTPIDFESLKFTGSIEFTADVVWGLQLQALNDPLFEKKESLKAKRELIRSQKASNPRLLELVCLKNRYGISSFSTYFKYYPANDYFEEDRGTYFDEKPTRYY